MVQHSEDIGTKADLSWHRLQTAKDALKAAKILFAEDEFIQMVEEYIRNKIEEK